MDFQDLSESSRVKARGLLTCFFCRQYFDDPRMLPCSHTFCLKCLQQSLEIRQAESTVRVGSIPCPRCKTMIGVPKSGVAGFPVDSRIGHIKNVVIDELARNISEKIHSQSGSDTHSSRSDFTDFTDFTDTSEDTRNPTSSSYSDFMTASESTDGSSYRRNPTMAKYAKYFVPDVESETSNDTRTPYVPRFRPTIRAERHRVGYSSSFQHKRRPRVTTELPKSYDDSSDTLRPNRYGSAPHINRDPTTFQASPTFERIYTARFREKKESGDTPQSRKERPKTTYEFWSSSEFNPNEETKKSDETAASDPLLFRNRYDSDRRSNESEPVEKASSLKTSLNSCHSEENYGSDRKENVQKSFYDKPSKVFTEKVQTLPTHRENIVTAEFESNDTPTAAAGKKFSTESGSRETPDVDCEFDWISEKFEYGKLDPEPSLSPTPSPTSFVTFRRKPPKIPDDQQDTESCSEDQGVPPQYDIPVTPLNTRKSYVKVDPISDNGSNDKFEDVQQTKHFVKQARTRFFENSPDSSGRESSSPSSDIPRMTPPRFKSHKTEDKNLLDETANRSAFNDRIFRMTIPKEEYENIMSDFKTGSINLEQESPDFNSNVVFDMKAKSKDKKERLSISDSNKDPPSCPTKEPEPEPEPPGRSLADIIQAARIKYSCLDDESSNLGPLIHETVCSDGVVPKWHFEKTEFGIPSSIAMTSKGCTIIAEYGNSCLEYFDAEGNFEHQITGIKPFAIAVNQNDQVVVGDRKGRAVRFFDEFGTDVAQWDSETFGWISGISFMRNGNVVVYDRMRCKIGVYTSGGALVKEFGSYGSSDYQICMADFLTVDERDRIIVCDSGNHSLKTFDCEGKFLGKMSGRGSDDGLLDWPKGVCTDGSGNIIVADTNNNRISMFSPDGKFIQHLILSTPTPYNLCFNVQTKYLGVTHYALSGFSQCDVYCTAT